MKTLFYPLLSGFLLICFNVHAQFGPSDVEDFGPARELLLGSPNTSEGTQFFPVGIDLWEGDDVNTIHYGQMPPDADGKPVIVFVHGYATNAKVWYEGNDNMYWDTYRDGYPATFVSLTPNRHIWTNGNMLARMLDQIIAHYHTEHVILVGWSKGGVDIDAALVHFGANARVSQVFTLSTPHFGTGIAELANSILLSLVNIIFMQNNEATLCLQRGYMNYFRSITDSNINNTIPYVTLGGWGNGPLARLSVPQGYLYLAGGSKSSGGNDGVVPYASSRRPGGKELFVGLHKEYFLGIPYYTGPDETDLDHFEITRGSKAWPYIKANIIGATSNTYATASSYNPNAIITSKGRIVAGSGQQRFSIEEGAGKVTITAYSRSGSSPLIIRNAAGEVLSKHDLSEERSSEAVTYTLDHPKSGKYTLNSDQEFVAIVETENGIEARLNTGLSNERQVYHTGEPMELSLRLTDSGEGTITKAEVTGTITRTTDLQLNRVDGAPLVMAFSRKGQEFVAQIADPLPAGVYNIAITATGDTFTKNVVTSIAIVGPKHITAENSKLAISSLYPNPFHDRLNISVLVGSPGARLTVYNIFGRKVKSFDLGHQQGHVQVMWKPSETDLKEGLYILELYDGKTKITRKVMMK